MPSRDAEMVTRLVEISAEMAAHTASIADLAAERQRLLVELHDAHGWSDGRIADAINVTRTAVQKARQGR